MENVPSIYHQSAFQGRGIFRRGAGRVRGSMERASFGRDDRVVMGGECSHPAAETRTTSPRFQPDEHGWTQARGICGTRASTFRHLVLSSTPGRERKKPGAFRSGLSFSRWRIRRLGRVASPRPCRHPLIGEEGNPYLPSALAILIALIPRCSPFSLSVQVTVTLSPAFTFLNVASAFPMTGAV